MLLPFLQPFYCSSSEIQTPSQGIQDLPRTSPGIPAPFPAPPALPARNITDFPPFPALSMETQASVHSCNVLPTWSTWLILTPLVRSSSIALRATSRVSCFLFSACEPISISLYNAIHYIVLWSDVNIYLSPNSGFIPNVLYVNFPSINVRWGEFNPSTWRPDVQPDGIKHSVQLKFWVPRMRCISTPYTGSPDTSAAADIANLCFLH